jgi:L-rhamnose isomerase/sugar isomerase
MIDQSHNVTDPIESMLSSAEAIAGCYARAHLVDREALHAAQNDNDVMLAFRTLRAAYEYDVGPILAKARDEKGGAIDWLATYRASRYRDRKAQERKPVGLGAGIV